MSSIKNEHDHIDGNLDEKSVLHDKAQYGLIQEKAWTLEVELIEALEKSPKLKTNQIAKGINDHPT